MVTTDKVAATLTAVEPNDTPPGPKVYRLERNSVAVLEVDEVGRGHTWLEGFDADGLPFRFDVSPVTQAVKVTSDIGSVTKVELRLIALPARIRALGMVDITDLSSTMAPEYAEALTRGFEEANG